MPDREQMVTIIFDGFRILDVVDEEGNTLNWEYAQALDYWRCGCCGDVVNNEDVQWTGEHDGDPLCPKCKKT